MQKKITHTLGSTTGLTQDDQFEVSVYTKSSNIFSVYLDNEITDMQDFRGAVQVMSMAGPEDTVNVYLNTPGGSVFGAMGFLHAANDCQAEIVYHASGSIASAGAIILSSADNFSIDTHAEVMYHTASGGTYGTLTQSEKQAAFRKKNIRAFVDFHCAGILTRAELEAMHDNNVEYYFTSEEFVERWKRKQACKDTMVDMVDDGEINPQDLKSEAYTELMLNLTDTYIEQQKSKPKKKSSRVKKPAPCSNSCC